MARIYIPQGWFRECGSLLEAEEGRGGAESRLRTSWGTFFCFRDSPWKFSTGEASKGKAADGGCGWGEASKGSWLGQEAESCSPGSPSLALRGKCLGGLAPHYHLAVGGGGVSG